MAEPGSIITKVSRRRSDGAIWLTIGLPALIAADAELALAHDDWARLGYRLARRTRRVKLRKDRSIAVRLDWRKDEPGLHVTFSRTQIYRLVA